MGSVLVWRTVSATEGASGTFRFDISFRCQRTPAVRMIPLTVLQLQDVFSKRTVPYTLISTPHNTVCERRARRPREPFSPNRNVLLSFLIHTLPSRMLFQYLFSTFAPAKMLKNKAKLFRQRAKNATEIRYFYTKRDLKKYRLLQLTLYFWDGSRPMAAVPLSLVTGRGAVTKFFIWHITLIFTVRQYERRERNDHRFFDRYLR